MAQKEPSMKVQRRTCWNHSDEHHWTCYVVIQCVNFLDVRVDEHLTEGSIKGWIDAGVNVTITGMEGR